MKRRSEILNTKLVKKVTSGGWCSKDAKAGRKQHNDG